LFSCNLQGTKLRKKNDLFKKSHLFLKKELTNINFSPQNKKKSLYLQQIFTG